MKNSSARQLQPKSCGMLWLRLRDWKMNKLIEITEGKTVWVGIRYTDLDGVEKTRKLYPSHYVGE